MAMEAVLVPPSLPVLALVNQVLLPTSVASVTVPAAAKRSCSLLEVLATQGSAEQLVAIVPILREGWQGPVVEDAPLQHFESLQRIGVASKLLQVTRVLPAGDWTVVVEGLCRVSVDAPGSRHDDHIHPHLDTRYQSVLVTQLELRPGSLVPLSADQLPRHVRETQGLVPDAQSNTAAIDGEQHETQLHQEQSAGNGASSSTATSQGPAHQQTSAHPTNAASAPPLHMPPAGAAQLSEAALGKSLRTSTRTLLSLLARAAGLPPGSARRALDLLEHVPAWRAADVVAAAMTFSPAERLAALRMVDPKSRICYALECVQKGLALLQQGTVAGSMSGSLTGRGPGTTSGSGTGNGMVPTPLQQSRSRLGKHPGSPAGVGASAGGLPRPTGLGASGRGAGVHAAEGHDDDEEEEEDDVDTLMARLKAACPPAEVLRAAGKEARRLRGSGGSESSVSYAAARAYLEVLADLPWSRLAQSGHAANMQMEGGHMRVRQAASASPSTASADPASTASSSNTADPIALRLASSSVPRGGSSAGGAVPTLKAAREVLDHAHYGLAKVKERVVEYLAVMRLLSSKQGSALAGMPGVDSSLASAGAAGRAGPSNGIGNSSEEHNATARAPILCFIGPPGVGKTSLARSIAEVLGRPFVRLALGGVRDEAEIRGHRRTYVGALPGRVIQGLRRAGVRDPVILLDEVDKCGRDSGGTRGDPGAALLEVLDPEQNHAFMDAYLGLPFDLSCVTFVATANSMSDIPPPLLDRLEVLHLSGYARDDKVRIAQAHLLPKLLAEHGLRHHALEVGPEAMMALVDGYTREAGVRGLSRCLAALCRHVAVGIVTAADEEQHARGDHTSTGDADSKAGDGRNQQQQQWDTVQRKQQRQGEALARCTSSGTRAAPRAAPLPRHMQAAAGEHAWRSGRGMPLHGSVLASQQKHEGVSAPLGHAGGAISTALAPHVVAQAAGSAPALNTWLPNFASPQHQPSLRNSLVTAPTAAGALQHAYAQPQSLIQEMHSIPQPRIGWWRSMRSGAISQGQANACQGQQTQGHQGMQQQLQATVSGASCASPSAVLDAAFHEGVSAAVMAAPAPAAGVGMLEQHLPMRVVVTKALIEQVLGPPRYQPGAEACERVSGPGVAAGLVWTQAGGAVQYIEAAVVGYGHVGQPGKLTLTGQAGDVLEESVQIALSWVRAHARPLGIPPADWTPTSTTPSTASKQHATLIAPELGSALFAPGMASAAQGVDSCKRRQSVAPASSGQAHAARMSEAELAETSPLCWDVHVHLPAGGVPKDGPSAGLPLALALLSLLTGRQLRADTAMTGELTLRGLVLPVGGVREKLLAAAQAGMAQVLVPARCMAEVQAEVPAACLESLQVVGVERMEQALAAAFDPPLMLLPPISKL